MNTLTPINGEGVELLLRTNRGEDVRHGAFHAGAAVRTGLDLKFSANALGPKSHDAQSHPLRAHVVGHKALPVVGDLETESRRAVEQLDLDTVGAAVGDGVVDGFLGDP